MKNITYAVNKDGFYARCGDRIAFFELYYKNMKPENDFLEEYIISDCSVFEFGSQNVRWTKKIPLVVKNRFRKHFGMSELKLNPSYKLVVDIESGEYLSHKSGFVKYTFSKSLKNAIRFNDLEELKQYNNFTISNELMVVEMK